MSLDAGTIRVLREHRSKQAEDRLLAGPEWRGGDLVFTTGLGSPIFPDTPSQLMQKLIKAHNDPTGTGKPKVQLPPARLHDLRHVHATMLLLAGVPVHVVAERLGHADPSITLRVYAHVIRRHAAGVAELFAREVEEDNEDDDEGPDEEPPAPTGTAC